MNNRKKKSEERSNKNFPKPSSYKEFLSEEGSGKLKSLFFFADFFIIIDMFSAFAISANFRPNTPSYFFVCFPQSGWSEQNSIINWIWETDSHLLQFEIKQLLVSLSSTWPQTSSSPLSGRGFKHVLYLVWFPWWHVWEHSVQVVHSVQSPLTNDKRSHCS